jgi:hypothetical protein
MKFTKQEVLDVCAQYGPLLKVPSGIDGPRLMAAIASVESSLGFDCGPRHEPTYDVGGSVYASSKLQQSLVAKYGSAAASSYGPWQMMFCNFNGETPTQLESDIDACARAFVDQFNRFVIRSRKASTLDEIGEVWNEGHITPDTPYTVKLEAAYDANLLAAKS